MRKMDQRQKTGFMSRHVKASYKKSESNMPRHDSLVLRHSNSFEKLYLPNMPLHVQTMPRHDLKFLKNKKPNFPSLFTCLRYLFQPTNHILTPYDTLQPPNQNPPKILKNLPFKHFIFTLFTNCWCDL